MSIIVDYTTSSIPHGILFWSENCIPIEAYIWWFFFFRLSCCSTSNRIRSVHVNMANTTSGVVFFRRFSGYEFQDMLFTHTAHHENSRRIAGLTRVSESSSLHFLYRKFYSLYTAASILLFSANICIRAGVCSVCLRLHVCSCIYTCAYVRACVQCMFAFARAVCVCLSCKLFGTCTLANLSE
jgi:hypothetical protein